MRSLLQACLVASVVVIHCEQRFKPHAVVANQLAEDGDWNSPLLGERCEMKSSPIGAAVVQFVTENRSEASADRTATESNMRVLLFDMTASGFNERFFVHHGNCQDSICRNN